MGAGDEKERASGEIQRGGSNGNQSEQTLPTVNPNVEKHDPSKGLSLPPSAYVVFWIAMSSSVILFNKWILDTAEFHFPIILTTWHLGFASLMTQILARTTHLLDGRKNVKMTGRVYLRAIMPIGLFFSLSLICGNLTYLYLSVAFIQMLKATTPVAVLISSWTLGVSPANYKELFNVSFIVIGVIVASVGEIKFVLIGVLYQIGGIIFEAIRLTMVQRLLSSAEYKMDPLVSLYYFAPVCTAMNLCASLVFEVPSLTMGDIMNVGVWTLLANALVAFALNVSVVFLIGKTSSLVMTLCGVLKDVLLVCASMAIWGTPISGLQTFGYAIALSGLIWYKLGADKIKEHYQQGRMAWADYGNRRPIIRKLLIAALTLTLIILLLGGLAPRYAPEGYDPKAYLANSRYLPSSLTGGDAATDVAGDQA